jgi:hypothetical protein
MADKPKREMTEAQKNVLALARARKAQLRAAAPVVARDHEPDTAIADAETPPPVEREPAPAVSEPEPEAEAAVLEAVARMRADLDPEVSAMFTDAELEQMYAESLAKAQAEKKAAAIKRLKDIAMDEARVEVGLVSGSAEEAKRERKRLAEPTSVTVDLPPGGGEAIYVDGKPHHHGFTYTVSLAQAIDMTSMMFRSWQHEAIFEGKDKLYYTRLRSATGTRKWAI